MALEIQPTEFVGAGKARIESELNAQLSAAKKLAEGKLRDIAKKAGLPFIPTSPNQIPKYAADLILKELNIPIPTELSVDGLFKMAKSLPIKLPFPLPTSLPTSVSGFIQQGLELAAIQFGPQALAYVGLGSVIPGVGNVIGAAIAITHLVVDLFAGAGKPYKDYVRYRCRGRLPGYWPGRGTPGKTVVESIVYTQDKILSARAVQAQNYKVPNSKSEYYGYQVLQCITDSQFALRHVQYPNATKSAPNATLVEVQAVLALFDKLKALYGSSGYERETKNILAEYQKRMSEFQKHRQDYQQILGSSLPKTSSALSQLQGRAVKFQNEVLKEARIAGAAVQSHGADYRQGNLKQFALAMSMYNALGDRISKIRNALNTATGATFAPSKQEAERQNKCRQLFAEWAHKNPQSVPCLTANEADEIFQGCMQAQRGQKVTKRSPSQIASAACQRVAAAQAKTKTKVKSAPKKSPTRKTPKPVQKKRRRKVEARVRAVVASAGESDLFEKIFGAG